MHHVHVGVAKNTKDVVADANNHSKTGGKCGTSYNPSVKHKGCVFNKLINSIR